jgi:GT2 family glycosyltransferase
MISIILPARNAPEWTVRSLQTLVRAVALLKWESNVEFLLLDDASDAAFGIAGEFRQFREQTRLPTRIFRFKQQQHYSRVFSAGLSWALGEKIFFLSNDMIYTPDFLKALLDVSNADPTIGIVRGTSNCADSHPEHSISPPFPLRTIDDVYAFSQFACAHWKQHFVDDTVLSGDAVVVNRALINRIGVIDSRYFGYFGDVDYGIRSIRAGFRLVCAKGAWLWHEQGGYVKDDARRSGTDITVAHARRLEAVQRSYVEFRLKWDTKLPEKYLDLPTLDFPELKAMQPIDAHRYFAPISATPELCESI